MHVRSICLALSISLVAACSSTPRERGSRPDRDVEEQYFHGCEPGTETPPKLVSGRTPLYPVKRLLADRDGHAVIAFDITATGEVEGLRKVEASHPSFYASTREAVAKWTFEPATQDGVPVRVRCSFQQSYSVPIKTNRRPYMGT